MRLIEEGTDLSDDGLVLVVARIDASDGSLVGEVEVVTRGFGSGQDEELIEETRLAAGAPTEAEILEMYRRYDLKDKGRPSWSQLREELRRNP